MAGDNLENSQEESLLTSFIQKIRSIQGVTEAYASDKRTTFVKLENQRIICLKGYNANPLYDCLREMYRAQENEQFLRYLQGSRSSGASSSDRQKGTYVIPDYDFGVSCSDNLRDYVLKKKFPGRDTPGSAASKNSLMSGSQSSLSETNSKVLPRGVLVGQSTRRGPSKISGKTEISSNPLTKKIPLLQKALEELKGTQYNNKKYHRATLRQIDQYMKNSFNADLVQIFTDSSAMNSSGVYADEDEDIFTLGASHQKLRQYENLPFKEHFPPLTTFSDESDGEDKSSTPGTEHSPPSKFAPQQIASPDGHRKSSDQIGEIREAFRIRHVLPQRRHTIASPQKKSIKPRYIKVYRPGEARPIFISGANTLGGLPEPSQSLEKRLSDRLKHKPIPTQNAAIEQGETKPAANSCPLICEVGEREAFLTDGYSKTSSFSVSYLRGRRYKPENSDQICGTPNKDSHISRIAQLAIEGNESQFESSLPMEKSLQEANDLVRTLFDDLSVGAPAPVITVASTNNPIGPGITTVSPSYTTSSVHNNPTESIPVKTNSSLGQFSESPRPHSSASSDNIQSLSSNSEERNTV